MTKIAVLVGSLRKESSNNKLAQAIIAAAPEGVEFVETDLHLPLFDQDVEATDFPKKATELKNQIESADGVLILTPEYNRGYSGVIKNALDWSSRPWGSNSFDGKPVALAGVSISPLGTTQAQSQLRNVLVYLNTKLMGQPEMYGDASRLFTEDGEVQAEAKDVIADYAAAVVAHVQAN